MNSQTRLKLTLSAAAFLALVTLLSIYSKMEGVATASIAGIMTILSAYIWSQTTRPSKDEYVNKNTCKQTTSKNSVPATFNRRSHTAMEK
jgi:hypothetical protein